MLKALATASRSPEFTVPSQFVSAQTPSGVVVQSATCSEPVLAVVGEAAVALLDLVAVGSKA